jgi:hypothetical protein
MFCVLTYTKIYKNMHESKDNFMHQHDISKNYFIRLYERVYTHVHVKKHVHSLIHIGLHTSTQHVNTCMLQYMSQIWTCARKYRHMHRFRKVLPFVLLHACVTHAITWKLTRNEKINVQKFDLHANIPAAWPAAAAVV